LLHRNSVKCSNNNYLQELAEELSLRNLGEIPGFPGHFLLERRLEEDVEPAGQLTATDRSGQPDHDLTTMLTQDRR
jgi:hypothetical protein